MKPQRHGVIEHLAQYGYDERAEVWVHTIAGHVATKYPGDYCSLERVDREGGGSVADGAMLRTPDPNRNARGAKESAANFGQTWHTRRDIDRCPKPIS